jgi:hypothetical protein
MLTLNASYYMDKCKNSLLVSLNYKSLLVVYTNNLKIHVVDINYKSFHVI